MPSLSQMSLTPCLSLRHWLCVLCSRHDFVKFNWLIVRRTSAPSKVWRSRHLEVFERFDRSFRRWQRRPCRSRRWPLSSSPTISISVRFLNQTSFTFLNIILLTRVLFTVDTIDCPSTYTENAAEGWCEAVVCRSGYTLKSDGNCYKVMKSKKRVSSSNPVHDVFFSGRFKNESNITY